MVNRRDKVMRAALSVVLVFGLAPSAAFARDGWQDAGAAATEATGAAAETGATQGGSASSSTGPDGCKTYVEGEVLVAYDDAYSRSKVSSLMEADELGAVSTLAKSQEIISEEGNQVIAKVELNDGVSVEDAIDQMSQDQRVEYAQPNFLYHLVEGADLVDDDISASGATASVAATEAADAAAGTAATDADAAAAEPVADTATVSSTDASPLTTQVNDPYANNPVDNTSEVNQWWLYSVNAFDAWDMSRANNSVTVAILDTGINFEHEDLKNNIDTEHAYDAEEGKHMTESRTDEGAGHGTHVAGIVAAEANNGLDFAGVSYNANILPVNVFYYSTDDSKWYAKTETLIKAYQYLKGLVNDGDLTDLHVINMSLGGYSSIDSTDLAFEKEISDMNELGVMTVCAGGNGDDYGNPITQPSYPGDYDECVSVVALQSSDERAAWADYNKYKDISAPGVNIFSTWINSESATKRASGTSMASPLVAGIVALLFAAQPEMSVEDAKTTMYSTAKDLGEAGWDQYYGWGKIDAAAMLSTLRGANIKGGSDEFYVTQSMSLSAELYTNRTDDPAEGTDWTWSVDKPSIATVSDDGVVTALEEGTVKVTVTSTVDPTVKGTKIITIKPIAVPDGITASPVDNKVKVQWLSAPAAAGYDVYRAAGTASADSWEKVGTVKADGSNRYEFDDVDVEVSTPYYYHVVPFGTLDGEAVYGTATADVVTMFKTTVMSYAGETRYDTMSQAVGMYAAERTLEGKSIRTVIVTSGTSFPDALAAAGLAGTQSCPIVTTDAAGLPQSSVETLTSINPKRVIVLGGEAAVSANVVDQIKDLVPNVSVRRVEGKTRYETATKIYDEGKGSWGKTAFVASGDNAKFADSLSVSPYLYASKSPLFLVDTYSATGLTASVLQRLKSGGFDRVVIVGGEASVPAAVEKQLSRLGLKCERWAGETRYETSQIIAQHGIEEGVLSSDEVGIATGEKPWDALAAGPLLGMQKNPMVLMDEGSGLAAAEEGGFIADNAKQIYRVTFFGGTASVPQTVRDAATEAAGL